MHTYIHTIRRNYEAGDALKTKKDYFVHFKFLPGLGFYGLGLIHMIGGLSSLVKNNPKFGVPKLICLKVICN